MDEVRDEVEDEWMGWGMGRGMGWRMDGIGAVEIKLSFLPKCLESVTGIESQRSTLSLD